MVTDRPWEKGEESGAWQATRQKAAVRSGASPGSAAFAQSGEEWNQHEPGTKPGDTLELHGRCSSRGRVVCGRVALA